MVKIIPNKLFVFEMANNHMGDIAHGLDIIKQFGAVCQEFPEFKFAFKLQYRDLDTFIHPSSRDRTDIKHVKRFNETRLTREELDKLVAQIRKYNFLTIATPFDEGSVSIIEEQKLNFIKIASCSFTDWPLLERIVLNDMPIIASTAGAALEDIDRVISFFQHRKKEFAILHCVGEYPTPAHKINLNQIDFLKARYPGVRVGFSTHEEPSNIDNIKLAVSKGAQIFEKHVGIRTERHELNAYSADPKQIHAWLTAARYADEVCGIINRRPPKNETELASLFSLRRGIFVARDIQPGELVKRSDVYFAFPPEGDQFTANDWSKYAQFTTSSFISKNSALSPQNSRRSDMRALTWDAARRVKSLLSESHIPVPGGADLEISHHYGMEKFNEFGLTLITVVNRGYCKKLLVSLPGQIHPEQYHNKKEETFHILYGEVELTLNGHTKTHIQGDVINIEPGVRHSFVSKRGAVIEELSSTHFKDDSFYTDDMINQNPNRKTFLTYWMD